MEARVIMAKTPEQRAAGDEAYLEKTLAETLDRLVREGHDIATVRAQAPALAAELRSQFNAQRSKLEGGAARSGERQRAIEDESVWSQNVPEDSGRKARAGEFLKSALPRERTDEELTKMPLHTGAGVERERRRFQGLPTQEKAAEVVEGTVGALMGGPWGKMVTKAAAPITRPLIRKGMEIVGNAIGGGVSSGAGRVAGNTVSDEREWHENVGDAMTIGTAFGAGVPAAAGWR